MRDFVECFGKMNHNSAYSIVIIDTTCYIMVCVKIGVSNDDSLRNPCLERHLNSAEQCVPGACMVGLSAIQIYNCWADLKQFSCGWDGRVLISRHWEVLN